MYACKVSSKIYRDKTLINVHTKIQLLLDKKLEILPKMKGLNWWLNINRMGDFNQLHIHPDVDFSLIYYLTNSILILNTLNSLSV